MQGFVAIYGGSFDPLHNGHREIIYSLCENPLYWHIILVPNFMNPLKSSTFFSATKRLEMCKIIAKECNKQYPPLSSLARVSVSDYEVRQNHPVYTIDSVYHIQNEFKAYFPKARYAFVLGDDAFNDLAKWHRVKDLCKVLDFVLVERKFSQGGKSLQDVDSENLSSFIESVRAKDLNVSFSPRIIDIIKLQNFCNISSSEVRLMLQNGDIKSAREMIPSSIHSIINTYFEL